MTVGGPFFEHELALLDDLAEGAGIEASLVRALLNEQIRSRADGRAGLRSAVDALLESAAVTVAQGRPFHAD